MSRPRPLILAVSLCLASSLGCSSNSDSPDQTPAVCEAPGYHEDAAPLTVEQVQASIVDSDGALVPNFPVQVCGLDRCFNGASNRVGQVNMAPHSALLRPAFKYGDGFEFAELALLLGPDEKQDLGTVQALPLPSYAEGAPFPKSGRVRQGDLTLSLDRNTTLEHDHLSYADSELLFRSVAIPIAQHPLALDPSFERAYAVAPLGTTFCPPARLSLPNSSGWAPNTEVEVFVQGLDVAEKWAAYGSWTQVAEARVSSDGALIESTTGGIPILSAIALRRK